MRYHVLFLFLFVTALTVSCDKNDDPLGNEPIATAEALNVSETSAVLSGYVRIQESSSASFGIIYSTKENPSLDNGKAITCREIDRNNRFFVTATNLQPATKYYYKAFLDTDGVYRVGDVKEFTTNDVNVSITTGNATEIGLYSAKLNGQLMVDSSEDVEKNAWFLFGSGELSLDELKTSGKKASASIASDGTISVSLQSLSYNTGYSFVACSKVLDKEFFGDVKEFTTNDVNVSITTGNATEIGLYSAKLNGQLMVDSSEDVEKNAWFLFGSGELSLDELKTSGKKASASIASDGTISVSLQSLSYNTGYSFVACSKVLDKEFFGDVKHFKTENISANVTTLNAAAFDWRTVSLNGSFTDNAVGAVNRSASFMYSDLYSREGDIIAYGETVSAEISSDGTFSTTLSLLKPSTTYHFVAVVYLNDMAFNGECKSFSTGTFTISAVDMGLPSGVKWADGNIGATAPENPGYYFAWGETAPKDNYTQATYNPTTDDTAKAVLNGKWRLPNEDDFDELKNRTYCDWEYTTLNGIYVIKVTSRFNGNHIVFPCGGRMIGTTLENTDFAIVMTTKGDRSMKWKGVTVITYCEKFQGISVRAVSQ